MKRQIEKRIIQLESSEEPERNSILVVERAGDEMAFESFHRGQVKMVIVTGVPRMRRPPDK